MKNYCLLFICIIVGLGIAQGQSTPSIYRTFADTVKMESLTQKLEKGPNQGKVLKIKGVKVEMVVPANSKKLEVNYFLYDSLGHPIETKTYKGTVKFVFGNSNQYLEASLIPTGGINQYQTKVEDWNECKEIIVTLKTESKTKLVFVFLNNRNEKQDENSDASRAQKRHGGDNRPSLMQNQGIRK